MMRKRLRWGEKKKILKFSSHDEKTLKIYPKLAIPKLMIINVFGNAPR